MEAFPLVRTRVRAAGGRVLRDDVGCLTPYAAQLLVEDLLHRGPGVRLEVTVVRGVDASALRATEDRLAPLARKGVRVCYRRMRPPARDPQPDAA
jgi:hypothetical protein